MTTHTPDNEHVAFDAMCAQIDDYQTLPSAKASSLEATRDGEPDREAQAAPLNEMILAGLVSP